jgi:hypothetical protein
MSKAPTYRIGKPGVVKDIEDRERLVRPVDTGRDILDDPTSGFRSTLGRDKRDPRRYNF